MKKNKAKKERELIAAQLFKALTIATIKIDPDLEDDATMDYCAYVMFSVLGAGIMESFGEKEFDSFVKQIKINTKAAK